MLEKKQTRGNLAVMGRLVGLVRRCRPVMVCAVLLGVAGFLCAIFIPVLGGYALLDSSALRAREPHRLHFAAGAGRCPRRAALCRAGLQPFYRLQAAGAHPGQGLRRAAPAGPGQAGGPRPAAT